MTKIKTTIKAKTSSGKARTLDQIVLIDDVRPVTDDLVALALRVPKASADISDYTHLRDTQPTLTSLIGRGLHHERELGRYLKMAGKSPDALETRVDWFHALNMIAQSSLLSAALLTAQTEDDVWARSTFGAALALRAKRFGDAERAAVIRAAFCVPKAVSKTTSPTKISSAADILAAFKEMTRRMSLLSIDTKSGTMAAPGTPGCYTLEQGRSLEAYFAQGPDLVASAERGIDLVGKADGWRAMSERSAEVGSSTADAAQEGALVMAYAAFVTVGLWPARSKRDLRAKATVRTLLCSRTGDPANMRAAAAIAFFIGNCTAEQGDRFKVEPNHATERFPGQG